MAWKWHQRKKIRLLIHSACLYEKQQVKKKPLVTSRPQIMAETGFSTKSSMQQPLRFAFSHCATEKLPDRRLFRQKRFIKPSDSKYLRHPTPGGSLCSFYPISQQRKRTLFAFGTLTQCAYAQLSRCGMLQSLHTHIIRDWRNVRRPNITVNTNRRRFFSPACSWVVQVKKLRPTQ